MGSMSLWHWFILIFFIVALGVPIAKILGRLGFSKWLTIVYFIPFVNIVGIWILAYVRWPAVNREQERRRRSS
jgi:hypothetical protein